MAHNSVSILDPMTHSKKLIKDKLFLWDGTGSTAAYYAPSGQYIKFKPYSQSNVTFRPESVSSTLTGYFWLASSEKCELFVVQILFRA